MHSNGRRGVLFPCRQDLPKAHRLLPAGHYAHRNFAQFRGHLGDGFRLPSAPNSERRPDRGHRRDFAVAGYRRRPRPGLIGGGILALLATLLALWTTIGGGDLKYWVVLGVPMGTV